MRHRVLERDQWADELTDLWRRLDGREVMIEVEALNLGDQVEAEHVVLRGLSYDPKDDVVQVWVGDLDHLIRQPTRILLALDEEERLVGIDITDSEGRQHLINPARPVAMGEGG